MDPESSKLPAISVAHCNGTATTPFQRGDIDQMEGNKNERMDMARLSKMQET
jgi:hypothetical protein